MRRSHSTAELLMRSGPRLPRPLPFMSYAIVGTAAGGRTAAHAKRGAMVWPMNAEVANVGTNAVMLFERSAANVVAVFREVAWKAKRRSWKLLLGPYCNERVRPSPSRLRSPTPLPDIWLTETALAVRAHIYGGTGANDAGQLDVPSHDEKCHRVYDFTN
jgi:hypothetical protein